MELVRVIDLGASALLGVEDAYIDKKFLPTLKHDEWGAYMVILAVGGCIAASANPDSYIGVQAPALFALLGKHFNDTIMQGGVPA